MWRSHNGNRRIMNIDGYPEESDLVSGKHPTPSRKESQLHTKIRMAQK